MPKGIRAAVGLAGVSSGIYVSSGEWVVFGDFLTGPLFNINNLGWGLERGQYPVPRGEDGPDRRRDDSNDMSLSWSATETEGHKNYTWQLNDVNYVMYKQIKSFPLHQFCFICLLQTSKQTT